MCWQEQWGNVAVKQCDARDAWVATTGDVLGERGFGLPHARSVEISDFYRSSLAADSWFASGD